jgi:phosphoesterase RecJ-like protein
LSWTKPEIGATVCFKSSTSLSRIPCAITRMKSTRLKIIDRILEVIGESHTIAVCSHMRPDGDCIGSSLGLALALLERGKEVTVWNQDPVPSKLRFLDPDQLIQTPRKIHRPFDCVIAVDSASIERLGTAQEHIANRKVLINIDHHASNTRFGDINWIASREPSSGELIYRLITEAGWKLTPRIADCLFTAISTDTGSFQYPSTLPATYYAAGDLVKKGADLATVCDEVYQSYPLSRVKLLQRVYNKFKLIDDNEIAYFWLKKEDFDKTGATASDTEGLIDHVRAIEPVVVACVFEELEPELTRISLRSKDKNVNVSDVAGLFGGGGHQAAAGARIVGKPLGIQRRVIAAIRDQLKSRTT